MTVIRIAGGVGSGKSRVLSFLEEEYGAHVILADEVARKLMEPGEPAYEKTVNLLGRGILDKTGAIDRGKMAEVIFNDSDALLKVNAITHPMTWRAIEEEVKASEAELIVVEAAVMGEEEPDIYDECWFIYASRETRIQRLYENRGYSREKSLSIMASQWSEEEFRKNCDAVIDNNGDLEAAKAQIREILEQKGHKKP